MNAREMIAQTVATWEQMSHPALLEKFVLRNGEDFVGSAYRGKRGPAKECFKNAFELVIHGEQRGSRYYEGFCHRQDFPLAFHHAWAVHDGVVLEPTLAEPEKYTYVGIGIDSEELVRETLKSGYYGVLDTGRGYNVEFMFRKDAELKAEAERILGREIRV